MFIIGIGDAGGSEQPRPVLVHPLKASAHQGTLIGEPFVGCTVDGHDAAPYLCRPELLVLVAEMRPAPDPSATAARGKPFR